MEAVIICAKETKRIITAEEHSIIGGLGEAIAGIVSETSPCIVKRVGVMDVFGESGEGNELLDKFGLRAVNIVEVANNIFNN